eukprot:TRINITY_DN585_c0_g1_i2.p1 TRINITY_DN585_c0_g1~~TRINITY_DN585_c0_g1_i2.p1  ORF type:complete len:634 (-),score=191.05 TRINITY_DN585_c0_g1_i2:881-2782(-)
MNTSKRSKIKADEEGLEKLKSLFHIPLKLAAKEMGVCPTNFKKYCRKFGIARWPHRKIKSIDHKIAEYKIAIQSNKTPKDLEQIEQNIKMLEDSRMNIIDNTITKQVDIPMFLNDDVKTSKTNKKVMKKAIKKPENNFNKMLLFTTNFFDGDNNVREFKIIDNQSIFTVQLGLQVSCTCGKQIEECPHLDFVMKSIFIQDETLTSMNNNEFDRLENSYLENASVFNCSMCYSPVVGHEDVYFFPKFSSYGHQECTKQCLNTLNKNLGNTPQFQQFLQNFRYTTVKNKEILPPHRSMEEEFRKEQEIQKRNLSFFNGKDGLINSDPFAQKSPESESPQFSPKYPTYPIKTKTTLPSIKDLNKRKKIDMLDPINGNLYLNDHFNVVENLNDFDDYGISDPMLHNTYPYQSINTTDPIYQEYLVNSEFSEPKMFDDSNPFPYEPPVHFDISYKKDSPFFSDNTPTLGKMMPSPLKGSFAPPLSSLPKFFNEIPETDFYPNSYYDPIEKKRKMINESPQKGYPINNNHHMQSNYQYFNSQLNNTDFFNLDKDSSNNKSFSPILFGSPSEIENKTQNDMFYTTKMDSLKTSNDGISQRGNTGQSYINNKPPKNSGGDIARNLNLQQLYGDITHKSSNK